MVIAVPTDNSVIERWYWWVCAVSVSVARFIGKSKDTPSKKYPRFWTIYQTKIFIDHLRKFHDK